MSWTEKLVSSMSDEVMPWCTKRDGGPMNSPSQVEEGDHVVLGHPLDGVDLLDVALGIGLQGGHRLLAALPDRLGGVLGNDPELGHGVAGMRLDLEPDAEAVLGRPDGRHLRPGVAGKHGRAFSPEGVGARAC